MKIYCTECEEIFEFDEDYDTEEDCPECGESNCLLEYVELTCLKCGEIWEGSITENCPSCNSSKIEEII